MRRATQLASIGLACHSRPTKQRASEGRVFGEIDDFELLHAGRGAVEKADSLLVIREQHAVDCGGQEGGGRRAARVMERIMERMTRACTWMIVPTTRLTKGEKESQEMERWERDVMRRGCGA